MPIDIVPQIKGKFLSNIIRENLNSFYVPGATNFMPKISVINKRKSNILPFTVHIIYRKKAIQNKVIFKYFFFASVYLNNIQATITSRMERVKNIRSGCC